MTNVTTQAEVSLYPLKARDISKEIDAFVRELEAAGCKVETGRMSSIASGDSHTLFAGLERAFIRAAEGGPVVLAVKVSNACPAR